jgi:predicted nucleic acid-binding protein
MMIVDSNAWADFFNGLAGPHVERLDAALRDEEDLAVLPIIVTEVLQGFRTETGFRQAERLLVSLPVVHPTLDCHVRAADLFRSLRRWGVTVRGAVDCVIAQACLDLGAQLLSPDRDFAQIARHTPLRLWRG